MILQGHAAQCSLYNLKAVLPNATSVSVTIGIPTIVGPFRQHFPKSTSGQDMVAYVWMLQHAIDYAPIMGFNPHMVGASKAAALGLEYW